VVGQSGELISLYGEVDVELVTLLANDNLGEARRATANIKFVTEFVMEEEYFRVIGYCSTCDEVKGV